jgi:hypothetical protein
MSKKTIEEMSDQVAALTRTYAIWWLLKEKKNTERYSPTMQLYPEFFITTIESLIQGFCIITYQLFDHNHGNKSLIALLKEMENVDTARAKRLTEKIDVQRPLLYKVFSIRGSVYAHRSKKESPERTFDNAKLSPNQMKAIVNLAHDVICGIADVAKVETEADLREELSQYEQDARHDTFSLMQDLEKAS